MMNIMFHTDNTDYESVKRAVLKAYELAPEAYCQKFRYKRKDENVTHVEYMRVKEQSLDQWLASKNVNQSYDNLRELILLEKSSKDRFIQTLKPIWMRVKLTLHIMPLFVQKI